MAPPHVQSAWGSRGERVRAAGLEEKKNHILGIYYELFDIDTLYIEEVDMNKMFNAILICGSMNYKKRR